MALRARVTSLAEANAFVDAVHRHHKRVTGHKFSIGCDVGVYWLVLPSWVGRSREVPMTALDSR
jgi:hypothetical protein